MERAKGRSLASPRGMTTKTDAPKLRKKLQKNIAKLRGNPAKRPGSRVSNEVPTSNERDPASKRNHQAQPCMPLVPDPDLSDAKWSEYLRSSVYLSRSDSAAQSGAAPRLPSDIIPEFSHLALNDETPRTSVDMLELPSPTSSSSTMRRRAKTPIFSIGQLEGIHLSRPRNALASDKTSSVELIAEQYRALLESRPSFYTDSHSEPPPSRHNQGDRDSLLEVRRQHSSDGLHGQQSQIRHSGLTAATPAMAAAAAGSPTSDDGTLVAFEEETVYFKPVSFSPEPLSPQDLEAQRPVLSPSVAPDNLSLQICLDLLTRDLASAATSRPNRSSPEASALQIWVMIEAYERLRDQLLDTRLRHDELGPLEVMFDMWLRALYTIHDSLTERGRAMESDYDGLDSEDLD